MTTENTVLDFVRRHDFSPMIFEKNPAKAAVWIDEATATAERLETLNHGIVAPTSGGKTVMALLAMHIRRHQQFRYYHEGRLERNLFLVPMRRLTINHQRLYEALGGKWQTRVITGETPANKRVWDDLGDQIVFATGHVVVE